MSYLMHETLHRSPAVMETIGQTQITICGAGALGANIAESLARSGYQKLRVIDRDRVEERNLSTQPYCRDDIGGQKAVLLGHAIYRAVGVKVEAIAKELDSRNVSKLLKGSDLVVDTFDNSLSRGAVYDHCRGRYISCLHAGLSTGYAEVLWNDLYRVPSASQDDICDYPLARNLVTLTVAVVCETILEALATGVCKNQTITLADLSIRPYS